MGFEDGNWKEEMRLRRKERKQKKKENMKTLKREQTCDQNVLTVTMWTP